MRKEGGEGKGGEGREEKGREEKGREEKGRQAGRRAGKAYYFNSSWYASGNIFLRIPHKLVSNCIKSALKDLGNLKD